jgi:hypothetical protein
MRTEDKKHMLKHPPYSLLMTAMRFNGETMESMANRLGLPIQIYRAKVGGEADFSIQERNQIRAILPYHGVDIFFTQECDENDTYEEEEYHHAVH